MPYGKRKEKYFRRTHFKPDFFIEKQYPFYVIIPVRREKKRFPETLASLKAAALRVGKDKVAFIVVINSSAGKICEENLFIAHFCEGEDNVYLIDRFREKRIEKGVGEARKLGMDHALFWGNGNAWMVSLDADTCVEENYFEAIDACTQAVVLADFHHRDRSPAMIAYERWLNYFKAGLAFAGSPYAYVPLGSRFALRSQAYVEVGGMVKRKAGEDFHFLQKLTKLIYPVPFGRAQTCVYPSGRQSDRVPWGTGPAIFDIRHGVKNYDWVEPALAFVHVRDFISKFDSFYTSRPDIGEDLDVFLEGENFEAILLGLRRDSKSVYQFSRQLHVWFDAMRTIRFVNQFTRKHGKEKIDEALEVVLEDR